MMNNRKENQTPPSELIGLIPAGGRAARIAPLPCSKEIFPIGFRTIDEAGEARPKAVCHYLLEKMRLAGVSKSFIILREGKWDIPTYLGDGTSLDMHLAYLMMGLPYGAPYTLDQAYPFVQNAMVVFGFPDILFQPDDAFRQLLNHQAATEADIVLGLFPADSPQKMDMVDLDDQGRIRQIVIKPRQTDLCYTWIIAVWTPVFTSFMHNYLLAAQPGQKGNDNISKNTGLSSRREVYVGDAIQAAIDAGMNVASLCFSHGTYLDIGTPEDLVKAVYTTQPGIGANHSRKD